MQEDIIMDGKKESPEEKQSKAEICGTQESSDLNTSEEEPHGKNNEEESLVDVPLFTMLSVMFIWLSCVAMTWFTQDHNRIGTILFFGMLTTIVVILVPLANRICDAITLVHLNANQNKIGY